MELPRHVHRYGGQSLIVRTQDALDAALASGWHLLPPQTPEPSVSDVLETEETLEPAEAAVVTPKRRGRPRKPPVEE